MLIGDQTRRIQFVTFLCNELSAMAVRNVCSSALLGKALCRRMTSSPASILSSQEDDPVGGGIEQSGRDRNHLAFFHEGSCEWDWAIL